MHYMRDTSIWSAAVLCIGCGSTGGEAALAPLRGGAGAAAQQQHKKAYVGLFGDDAVGVLDLETGRVLTTLPVTAPDGLVITPDGRQVFVSSTDTGTVVAIATQDDHIVTAIDVGAKPAGLTLTPDGSKLIAAVGGADQAVIIDTGSHEVLGRAAVGQAHSSCAGADNQFAYVGSQVSDAPAIVQIDVRDASVVQRFAVDKSPRALACEADAIYFTVVGLDALEKLDPRTGALATPIATGGSPHDVRAAQPGKLELVVSQTAGDLELVDVPSASTQGMIPTGKLAHWIAVEAGGETAYVSNEGDDNVTKVDLALRKVSATYPVGKAPRKLALQP